MVMLLAQQEALIDFPEEDLPESVEAAAMGEIASLWGEMRGHLDDGRRGERLREGLVFAVIGPPNSGKSTLVNALAEREVAIVSAIPGTTRDVLEVRLDIAGVPVTLLDTAGLRDTDDEVELEGVRRARARAASADLVVAILDSTHPSTSAPVAAGHTVLRVATKVDLATAPADADVRVCAPTGLGMEALRARLAEHASRLADMAGPPALTRARHRAALIEAAARLDGARDAVLPELRGEELRMALRALGRITGEVGVEEILDSVFRQFCIGK
jgi:tRNA modification GTPase